MESVKFLRLDSGDDLVSEIVEVEHDNPYYLLVNPLKIVYVPTQKSGYIQVAMMPWIMSRLVKETEFVIDPEKVLIMTEASDSIIEYYYSTLEMFSGNNVTEEVSTEEEDNTEERLQELLETFSKGKTYH